VAASHFYKPQHTFWITVTGGEHVNRPISLFREYSHAVFQVSKAKEGFLYNTIQQ
jgi:hypothetical protein